MRLCTVCSWFVLTVISILFFASSSFANNLSVSNVALGERNVSTKTVAVNFNVSWENSWRTKINHDAVWLTVRLYNPSSSPAHKKLCQISASGLNPVGSSVGSNSSLEVFVPADKYGAFVRPSSYGINASMSSTSVKLTVDYNGCGFADSETVYASVLGIEMVNVPEGSFYAGDYDQGSASLNQGSSDSDPWRISSESSINVTNITTDGYRYLSAGNSGEDATGSSFSVAQDFPKGYKSFYVMKYEITEADWVEFVNSLSSDAARSARDLTDGVHKNSDSVRYRNTINCSGSPLTCSTSKPSRAVSYLTWMDLAAYLDWAALRPMTELEFEKVARGPLLSVPGEFAWGSVTISAASIISTGSENGSETVGSSANANYLNTVFSGGDAVNGAEYTQGPLRIGVFASSSSSRESAGAGYYGAMELSGNLKERVVTIGNEAGRLFTGVNGDGQLSNAAGYEGNANAVNWPGLDSVVVRGVTGASGSGFRGGSWVDGQNRLRISDRFESANALTDALNFSGGRGVRTYDSN